MISPLIGKTLFLYYALIERILDKEPTAFQLDSKRVFVFFGPTDVQVCPNGERLDPEKFPGAWALVDSNASLIQPEEKLISDRSKYFVIQATSPQPLRWKAWSKYCDAELAVMKAWSWPELYIGGQVNSFVSSCTYRLPQDPS